MYQATMCRPLPDTTFYRVMARGHLARKGHALRAHLESDTGEVWQVARECCSDDENTLSACCDHGK